MNKSVYEAVMSGKADHSINYNDFQNLMVALGFVFVRQKGSHTLYRHSCGAMMNVQKDGAKAKAYQVAQLRKIVNQYSL